MSGQVLSQLVAPLSGTAGSNSTASAGANMGGAFASLLNGLLPSSDTANARPVAPVPAPAPGPLAVPTPPEAALYGAADGAQAGTTRSGELRGGPSRRGGIREPLAPLGEKPQAVGESAFPPVVRPENETRPAASQADIPRGETAPQAFALPEVIAQPVFPPEQAQNPAMGVDGRKVAPDAGPAETPPGSRTRGIARQVTARAKEPDAPVLPGASPVPFPAVPMPPEAASVPPPSARLSAASGGAIPPPDGSVSGAVEPAPPRRPASISAMDAPPAASEQRIASAAHEPRSAPSSAPEQQIKAGPLQETGRLDLLAMPPPNLDIAPPPRPGVEPASAQSKLFAAPADQVGSAAVAIVKSADGTQSLTIRLNPEDLGAVHIRIVRSIGGEAHVGISADRPETLQLLRQDEQRLQQALDRAGVSPVGRTVSFDVAPPQSANDPAGSRLDGMAAGAGGSGHGQGGHERGHERGYEGGGSLRDDRWRQGDDARPDRGDDPNANREQARARWLRAGLDIVA